MVYVETPEEAPHLIDAEAQRHLLTNIERARELGAEVVRLKGDDAVAALLDFARSHGVGEDRARRSRDDWWRQSPDARRLRACSTKARSSTSTSPRARGARAMTLRSKLLLGRSADGDRRRDRRVLASVTNGKLGRSSELILKDDYAAACWPRSA